MQREFVLSMNESTNISKQSVLDIGCGTGNLTIELAEKFAFVTGIDLNEDMVSLAEKKSADISNIKLYSMNMLDIIEKFGVLSKDIILTFGNTLVHLSDESMIKTFLKRTYDVLTDKGILLVQIINYDRILDNNIKGLSTIDNEHIKFERIYNYEKNPKSIDFETVLTLKESGLVKKNSVSLFPLRKSNFQCLLQDIGFKEISFYGGFNQCKYSKDSIPMVVRAKKG